MMCRLAPLAGVVASVVALSSCAALDVNALPQPGNSYRGGYEIVIEFDNVLNLPDRAKVVLDGTTVGVVTKIKLASRHVDVTARIERDIAVPSNIRAVLQQATVLGDIYVALERPQDDPAHSPTLHPGGRIPLEQTMSPPQLEDTIARLATFVSSGSIQRVQNTIIGLNRVTPPGPRVRELASQVSADLLGLSNNIDQVDQLLDGMSRLSDVMHNDISVFQRWFSPKGMLGFDRYTFIATYIATMLPAVGSIYSGGFWLVPLLNSLADALGAIRSSKLSVEEEVPAWRHLFTDFFLPQDKYPAINITSIVGPDGRELSGNVHDVLRILGAVP